MTSVLWERRRAGALLGTRDSDEQRDQQGRDRRRTTRRDLHSPTRIRTRFLPWIQTVKSWPGETTRTEKRRFCSR